MVRLGKYYSEMIGADDGLVDMSWNVIEKQSFLFNTTVDRLWIDLHFDKFPGDSRTTAHKLGTDFCMESE